MTSNNMLYRGTTNIGGKDLVLSVYTELVDGQLHLVVDYGFGPGLKVTGVLDIDLERNKLNVL